MTAPRAVIDNQREEEDSGDIIAQNSHGHIWSIL